MPKLPQQEGGTRAAPRGAALPKPLPLPSFRSWPSLTSSRMSACHGTRTAAHAAAALDHADVVHVDQLVVWIGEELRVERVIDALRWV